MTPNQTLNGRYKIIRSLGEGGMANVYLAHDLILDRDVAVKLVRFDMQDDLSAIKRFQREVLSTTELVHPNIVGVYDIGEEHGMNYLVMEYVEGTDLKQYIRDKFPIPLDQVVNLMGQILNGVQTAHRHGIIHRDLKPQNVLIDTHGNAKITDFGIAIANQQSSFTRTNAVIGSVQYLSPEQVRGHIATQQSDIYSLGIILFEMLTGKVPFEGESAVSIAVKHYQDQLPLVKDFNDKIPQSLENVVLKATAKNPTDRYKNVAEMADDLKTVLEPDRANEPKFIEDSLTDRTIVLDQTEINQNLQPEEIEKTRPIEVKMNNRYNNPRPPKETSKNSEEEMHRPKHRHPLRRRALFTFMAAVAFILGIFIAFKLSSPQMVQVPSLEGLNQKEATTKLSKANLGVGKITKEADDKAGYNKVVETLPETGKYVQEGIKVNVVISKGPNSFDVDNYVGSDYTSTKKQLEDKGFKIKKKEIATDRFDDDRIISQDVISGQVVVPRVTTITFTVAK
ncbi:Stk1 family PASTA domain-containing Ser/Thr kinase [Pediococcus stilesii]|uniref:non-specific serine/threonine protein kinase n=1 Tax=Pediococcus stilesii TaxID=331679 RepID=A0A0R2L790_9LACO|nr:Stk1 family PASTA domain-containing Ser/Thr kinase [Pediococcus stilesii]KRN95260.1 serine threonine kinase protein [Pediococcus stilesii]